MRNTFLLILFISPWANAFAASHSNPIPYGSMLNFTVNLNNVQEARATNANTFTVPQSDSPLLDKLSQVWTDPNTNQNLVKRFGNNTGSFIGNHKWHILMAGILGTYAYACYIIASGNSYFAHKDLWSSWRQDLALEQLLAIPQPQFAKELLQEIQRRYTDPAAVTDIVRPLGMFMKMIELEEQQLLWYQAAFGWIEYSKVIKIIPFSTAAFSTIALRLQRLAYYKNVFQTWAAQYQLEQVSKALSFPDETASELSSMAALMSYHYKISLLRHLAKKRARTIPTA